MKKTTKIQSKVTVTSFKQKQSIGPWRFSIKQVVPRMRWKKWENCVVIQAATAKTSKIQ